METNERLSMGIKKSYSMNPQTVMKLVFSLRRTHIIILSSFLAFVTILVAWIVFTGDLKRGLELSWLIIFFMILDIWIARIIQNLKTYSAVKKIEFNKGDDFVITTAKNKQFRIKYEDLGLIDATKGVKLPAQIFYYPWVKVIYYNHKLGKCIEIYLSREAGEALMEEYRKYCKSHNCIPCPILEGIVETSEVEDRAIKRIKSSSFCNRG